MALIEPVFTVLHETPFVFALGFPVPWLRMVLEPVFLFLAPFQKECLWNGVSEAERDKVRRSRLFPVWQISASLNDLAAGIEAVERDIASRMLA